MSKINHTDYIKAHLNVAWLRPESAFWDVIASTIISKYENNHPSLDLGCGNGIFSFITAGGEFSIDYDWYINVNTEGFWKNKDIYDACKISTLAGFITKKPRYTFTIGLDHKPNLLKQAKALNFYGNLFECDANLPLHFKDEEFKTIFSNILYWLDDVKQSLSEIYRILEGNGIVILCVPNTKFYDYCFTYHWKKKNSELLRLLNRGRSECMHWTSSYNDFVSLAKSVGFDVVDHSYYLSPRLLKMWDIGLRPISPLLVKMANSLTKENRRDIKMEWLETLTEYILPLYEMEIKCKDEGGFHLFVLKK